MQADAARICAASKVDDIAFMGVLCVSSGMHRSLLRIALNHKAAVPNFLTYIIRFPRVKFAKRFYIINVYWLLIKFHAVYETDEEKNT